MQVNSQHCSVRFRNPFFLFLVLEKRQMCRSHSPHRSFFSVFACIIHSIWLSNALISLSLSIDFTNTNCNSAVSSYTSFRSYKYGVWIKQEINSRIEHCVHLKKKTTTYMLFSRKKEATLWNKRPRDCRTWTLKRIN